MNATLTDLGALPLIVVGPSTLSSSPTSQSNAAPSIISNNSNSNGGSTDSNNQAPTTQGQPTAVDVPASSGPISSVGSPVAAVGSARTTALVSGSPNPSVAAVASSNPSVSSQPGTGSSSGNTAQAQRVTRPSLSNLAASDVSTSPIAAGVIGFGAVKGPTGSNSVTSESLAPGGTTSISGTAAAQSPNYSTIYTVVGVALMAVCIVGFFIFKRQLRKQRKGDFESIAAITRQKMSMLMKARSTRFSKEFFGSNHQQADSSMPRATSSTMADAASPESTIAPRHISLENFEASLEANTSLVDSCTDQRDSANENGLGIHLEFTSNEHISEILNNDTPETINVPCVSTPSRAMSPRNKWAKSGRQNGAARVYGQSPLRKSFTSTSLESTSERLMTVAACNRIKPITDLVIDESDVSDSESVLHHWKSSLGMRL